VYQQGWRLGGKGASGRGPGGRIEEHGLHLWMGHYDNAFQLMRECYRELARDPRHCPIADWTDAFTPAPFVSLTDRTPDGRWRLVSAHFPPFPGLPGDPFTVANPRTVPPTSRVPRACSTRCFSPRRRFATACSRTGARMRNPRTRRRRPGVWKRSSTA
jgi:uncharacterized protein with NAD-binding domain and iron-sulfur cluster